MSDTALPAIIRFDTTANRMAFTPSPGVSEQLYIWLDSDDQPNAYYWDGAAWQVFNAGGGGGGTTSIGVCNGRLTTESGVPVSITDRTAQSTIYWTPYLGNQIGLYDGADWQLVTFSELSLALSGLTNGKNYDVFIDYNGGTPQIVLSAAWTNDTTRADALALQDGIYVKSGATDLRWIGTIRTTSTTTTEDSNANRFVWNYYNQVERPMKAATETANSWTYNNGTTWQQANANTANQLMFVAGTPQFVRASIVVAGSGGTGFASGVAIGVNSVTTPSTPTAFFADDGAVSLTAMYYGYCQLGYNYLSWMEFSNGGTATFFGDAGNPSIEQSGIIGSIFN